MILLLSLHTKKCHIILNLFFSLDFHTRVFFQLVTVSTFKIRGGNSLTHSICHKLSNLKDLNYAEKNQSKDLISLLVYLSFSVLFFISQMLYVHKIFYTHFSTSFFLLEACETAWNYLYFYTNMYIQTHSRWWAREIAFYCLLFSSKILKWFFKMPQGIKSGRKGWW